MAEKEQVKADLEGLIKARDHGVSTLSRDEVWHLINGAVVEIEKGRVERAERAAERARADQAKVVAPRPAAPPAKAKPPVRHKK
jgi:hypothetical protein